MREPAIKTRVRIHPDGGWGVQRWREAGYLAVFDDGRFGLLKSSSFVWIPYRFDTAEKAKEWLRRYLRSEQRRATLPASHPRSTRHED